ARSPASDGRSRGKGGAPALLQSVLSRRSGAPPFPLRSAVTRRLRLLVAGHALLAWGRAAGWGGPLGEMKEEAEAERPEPGDIRPKGHPARQEALAEAPGLLGLDDRGFGVALDEALRERGARALHAVAVVQAGDARGRVEPGAGGQPAVGFVARIEVAQRAHVAVAGAGVAQADGQLVDGRRLAQRELCRAGVDAVEVQAVLLRVQVQPGRRDHHRHVVAGLGGELAVDVGVPEPAAAAGLVDTAGAALAAVVAGQRELDA